MKILFGQDLNLMKVKRFNKGKKIANAGASIQLEPVRSNPINVLSCFGTGTVKLLE